MNALDIAKLVLAGVLVATGIAGYYVLSEQALILRVLAVIGGTVAGAAVAWFTVPGKTFARRASSMARCIRLRNCFTVDSISA